LPQPISALPEHYTEAREVVLTAPKTLLWLNVASLLPLAIALLLLAQWSATIQRLRGPYNTVFSETLHWLPALIVVFLLTFGGHEALHGLAIRWAGHRPRFGMKLRQGVLYATADGAYFSRRDFIIVALAPLVGLSAGGLLAMLVLPDALAYYAGLTVALNAAGAIGMCFSREGPRAGARSRSGCAG
jgi:hypothetical protein